MKRNLIITAILGILAVILGAFGAHTLKQKLGIDALQSFETGVRYQMYHVIILLFVNSYSGLSSTTKNWISWLFFVAIFFFSGSIYAITVGGIDPKYIWYITPLGGLLFIGGWFLLLLSFIKKS